MKVKLDPLSIICPQVHHDIFGNEFTVATDFLSDNFWGDGEYIPMERILNDYCLAYGEFGEMAEINVDHIRYSKGFKIDAKTKR